MEKAENFEACDLDECARLYVRVFNREPWNDEWTFATARKKLNEIFDTPNFKGVIFKKNGKIVGAVIGNCEQWYTGMHYNLKEFFVTPEIQGKGIGTKMLMQLERELKGMGVVLVHLFTSKKDFTRIFYEKNGYRQSAEMALMFKDFEDL